MKRASPAQKKLVANAINRVKLRHLTVLLEVARCGSARAAARTLCVTESAVSKTLKELETELDLRLFERSKSGMSITEAGLRFANYAESAVQALRIGMSSAHDALGVGAVAFSIGAMPIVATSILPAATQRLMDETPGLCLEVISGSKGICIQAFAPSMREGRNGRVVSIGSRMMLGRNQRTVYGMVKAGLLGMSRSLALELAPFGITVNMVSPGPIETELFRQNHPSGAPQTEKVLSAIPVGRIGTADDVANAVAFFLSSASSFITGQNLFVCGGGSVGAAGV